MQIAAVEQRLHQHRHAADIVQILHHIAAARLQIADIGGALADFAKCVQIEIDAGLVGDRRDVQSAIGRAAGGGDHGRGVLDRLASDDVARADVPAQQFHDRLPRGLGIGVARIIGRRGAGRAGQGEADRLRHAGHRVGGEEAAARAGRRAGGAFELMQFLVGELADTVRANPLEHVADGHVAALESGRGGSSRHT